MKERDAGYIWDIVNAGREIAAFVQGKRYADLERDKMFRLAVERNIEIIGEAARRLSDEFRSEHPEVPWARIVAQRNVIAHEYGDIRLGWIWRVATKRVPELVAQLETLLPPLPEEGRDASE